MYLVILLVMQYTLIQKSLPMNILNVFVAISKLRGQLWLS